MPSHPDDLVLTTWLDGAVEPPPATADHIAACSVCQERLAALAAEARGWRAALALTVDEMSCLRQCDLPGRLLAAITDDAAVARISAGVRQLALLVALALSVAVAWALVAPWLDEAWRWVDPVIDVPTLALLLLVQAALGVTGSLTALADNPGALLSNQAALLATGLAFVIIWRRWPRSHARTVA